jgi:hypothetical protein
MIATSPRRTISASPSSSSVSEDDRSFFHKSEKSEVELAAKPKPLSLPSSPSSPSKQEVSAADDSRKSLDAIIEDQEEETVEIAEGVTVDAEVSTKVKLDEDAMDNVEKIVVREQIGDEQIVHQDEKVEVS